MVAPRAGYLDLPMHLPLVPPLLHLHLAPTPSILVVVLLQPMCLEPSPHLVPPRASLSTVVLPMRPTIQLWHQILSLVDRFASSSKDNTVKDYNAYVSTSVFAAHRLKEEIGKLFGLDDERTNDALITSKADVPLGLQYSATSPHDVCPFREDHPLHEVWHRATSDVAAAKPMEFGDHGFMMGHEPMPTRRDLEACSGKGFRFLPALLMPTCSVAQLWRLGKEHEVNRMSRQQQEKLQKKATDHWSFWLEHDAVRVLSEEERAERIRHLTADGRIHEVMQPRWVLTDKNAWKSATQCPLEDPSSRLIVPGFQDVCFQQGQLRSDAPTACRDSQHLLCYVGGVASRLVLLLCVCSCSVPDG